MGHYQGKTDYCDEKGAALLAAMIQQYWAEQGYDVRVKLVHGNFSPIMRSARVDIRSNMVNGRPSFQ